MRPVRAQDDAHPQQPIRQLEANCLDTSGRTIPDPFAPRSRPRDLLPIELPLPPGRQLALRLASAAPATGLRCSGGPTYISLLAVGEAGDVTGHRGPANACSARDSNLTLLSVGATPLAGRQVPFLREAQLGSTDGAAFRVGLGGPVRGVGIVCETIGITHGSGQTSLHNL